MARPGGARHGVLVVALLGVALLVHAEREGTACSCRSDGCCDAEAEADAQSLLQHRRGAGVSAPPPPSTAGRQPNKTFLWMSDPHADVLYGKPPPTGKGGQNCKKNASETAPNEYGMEGCDPPYSLLISAAKAAAKNIKGTVEFVLFTGDFARHGTQQLPNPWANVTETIHNVSVIIKNEVSAEIVGYPNVNASQGFGTLGNNDSPDNYYINITTDDKENSWISSVAGALTSAGVMAKDQASEYSYGGFFEEEMGGLTIVQLNTIVWSAAHQPETKVPVEDPFLQFSWLRSRLEAAAKDNRTVWIVGHIPPGIETFGYTELWKPMYVKKYLEIVQDPLVGPVVAAQLFGHTHKEEFRILPNAPAGAGPIIITAAMSPIYYNNSPFRYFEYDPVTKRPLNFKEYYTEMPHGSDSPAWQFGYDLLESYEDLKKGVEEVGALQQSHFEGLVERLKLGLKDWDTYSAWYATQFSNDLTGCSADEWKLQRGNKLNPTQRAQCRHQYTCAMTVMTQDEFNECVQASEYVRETQQLAEPLLGSSPRKYYPVMHEHWISDLTSDLEHTAWLHDALSDGRFDDIAVWNYTQTWMNQK